MHEMNLKSLNLNTVMSQGKSYIFDTVMSTSSNNSRKLSLFPGTAMDSHQKHLVINYKILIT